VKTYLNKRGEFSVKKTGIMGGSDKEALHLFNGTVRHALVNQNLFAVMLVTERGEKLAEWSRNDEMAVA
jgi:hypothetical protein